ncbi:MAG: hypothetical protein PSV16_14640 [Flavobacterium sp.]|nr:hypothetical protein [Flavobacterium sp.]
METIFQKEWDYTFSKNGNNKFILSVVCGSIALFEVDIILNQEEINRYNEDGEKFISSLAKTIREKPENWGIKKN